MSGKRVALLLETGGDEDLQGYAHAKSAYIFIAVNHRIIYIIKRLIIRDFYHVCVEGAMEQGDAEPVCSASYGYSNLDYAFWARIGIGRGFDLSVTVHGGFRGSFDSWDAYP